MRIKGLNKLAVGKIRCSRNKYNVRSLIVTKNQGEDLKVRDFFYPVTRRWLMTSANVAWTKCLRWYLFKDLEFVSLRQCDNVLQSGRVQVNGIVVKSPYHECKIGDYVWVGHSRPSMNLGKYEYFFKHNYVGVKEINGYGFYIAI
uniref:RNA-binding S4 domain-containing protein n=1 Tax=Sphaerothecum destruens TaxID=42893 RepID=A0A6H2U283_9EUKA|nr:hypothetical protein [Sphaerothecum destruens]QID02686.1 hypothetical protein [Sphaerothecum destruens]